MHRKKYTPEEIRRHAERFFAVAGIEFLGAGNDCEAFCVNDAFVFKFPKHAKANRRLQNEMAFLRQIRDRLEVEVPNVLCDGTFDAGGDRFSFFASKKLRGETLTKAGFLALGPEKLERAAAKIAGFLKTLHGMPVSTGLGAGVPLHGDFSLDHVLFWNGEVSGILDFADTRTGKPEDDFVYLLDDADPDEFGRDFGEAVLRLYLDAGGGTIGI